MPSPITKNFVISSMKAPEVSMFSYLLNWNLTSAKSPIVDVCVAKVGAEVAKEDIPNHIPAGFLPVFALEEIGEGNLSVFCIQRMNSKAACKLPLIDARLCDLFSFEYYDFIVKSESSTLKIQLTKNIFIFYQRVKSWNCFQREELYFLLDLKLGDNEDFLVTTSSRDGYDVKSDELELSIELSPNLALGSVFFECRPETMITSTVRPMGDTEIAQLIFPNGMKIKHGKFEPVPTKLCNLITGARGTKIYSVALKCYEELAELDTARFLTSYAKFLSLQFQSRQFCLKYNPEEVKLYFPKALTFILRYNYAVEYSRILQYIYQVMVSRDDIPNNIWHFVSRLLNQKTFVSQRITLPGRLSEVVHLDVRLNSKPRYSPRIFNFISIKTFIHTFQAIILGEKVVMISSHESLFFDIMHTLHAAIFPMSLNQVCVPLCPTSLLDLVDAPVGYILGFTKSKEMMAKLKENIDANILDIDEDRLIEINKNQKNPPSKNKRNPKWAGRPVEALKSAGFRVAGLECRLSRKLLISCSYSIRKFKKTIASLASQNPDFAFEYTCQAREEGGKNHRNLSKYLGCAFFISFSFFFTDLSNYINIAKRRFDEEGYVHSFGEKHKPFLVQLVATMNFKQLIEQLLHGNPEVVARVSTLAEHSRYVPQILGINRKKSFIRPRYRNGSRSDVVAAVKR